MIRLRLTKIDERQFLTCLKHALWGSRSARFKDWREGDYLGFIVDKCLVALAQVTGKPFQSKQRIWDNGLYPHRISVRFLHVLQKEDRIPVLGRVREALTSSWGPTYGWGIRNQQTLGETQAQIITDEIRSRPNGLTPMQASMDQLLSEASVHDEVVHKRRRARPTVRQLPTEKASLAKEEESSHSRAQAALIRLGRITGCSTWIASNDRNRPFEGKPMGDDCLSLSLILG